MGLNSQVDRNVVIQLVQDALVAPLYTLYECYLTLSDREEGVILLPPIFKKEGLMRNITIQNNKTYRLSRWCNVFINNDVMALFHSLSLAVVFLPKKKGEELIDFLEHSQSLDKINSNNIGIDIIDLLVKEKMLVLMGMDDLELLRKLRDSLMKETTLEFMYLLLTDGCNLRCDYCFEEAPLIPIDFKPVLMSEETAKEAIDYFDQLTDRYGRSNQKKIIHLYGGEPLLNKNVIKYVISHISNINKMRGFEKYEVVIVTNGILIDEDIAKLFSSHQVTVGISLDGPQDINDIHRKSESKKSFQRIINGYNILKKHGVQAGISATLTPAVVKNFDRVLDFFIKDLGIQDGISFNILHYSPTNPVGADYFKDAAKCIIKAFTRFRMLGIYEERMMRKAEAFIGQKAMFADCGVIGNQIVVAPDGKIGVCQDYVKPRTYFNGSVFDKNYDPFKQKLFNGWDNRSPLFMDQCLDCDAIGICGGGCPASVELKTGSRWNIDKRICDHSKLSLEWLIWETFKKLF